jgi:hypothetical protein
MRGADDDCKQQRCRLLEAAQREPFSKGRRWRAAQCSGGGRRFGASVFASRNPRHAPPRCYAGAVRGQTFVGMIEQLADAGHNIDVRLDVMPEVNVARAVRSPGRLLGDDVPLEPSMLTLRTTRRVARRVLCGPLSEGRWVRVNVGDRGIEGKVYPGRVGELPAASPVRIGPSSPLRAAERELLTLAFTLPQSDDGMRNRLADWLFFTPRDIYPESLICLDVGQGSAVALTRFGRPKVYFDVGAGCFANARTRPPALKFCTRDSPIVMLSHWDADHWFGAWTDAELQKRDWVCPRQTIGPFATEFARLFRSKGRLLVWPDERSSGRPLPLSRSIRSAGCHVPNGS